MGETAVAWKYYDRAFNRGNNRGFVWLRDGAVAGMVGLIPVQRRCGPTVMPLSWTCDWGLADPSSSPGMGIRLLKTAVASAGCVASFGGNANTRSLLPRMAVTTLPDAGISLWRPLRSGALLRVASKRRPVLRRFVGTLLGRVPIPRRPRRRPKIHASFVVGVAPALESLLESLTPAQWSAHYDLAYLQWALERAPDLDPVTCLVRGQAGVLAAAVLWHPRAHPSNLRPWHVKCALWYRAGARDAAVAVADEVIRRAQTTGAEQISTIVTSGDDTLDVFRNAGFVRRRATRSLYLLAAEPTTLHGLSYFATDLAQRF
jgi:hypothetical protein